MPQPTITLTLPPLPEGAVSQFIYRGREHPLFVAEVLASGLIAFAPPRRFYPDADQEGAE